ncbi:MAG: HlyD family efflux transporter periplasmic adaptor subunit [Planctomycetaceae bacterium]
MAGQTAASRSLNSQIRSMLVDCPSRQALLQRVLDVCSEQFPTTVGRADFRVGESRQSYLQHDPRMAKNLAERFSAEYLQPMADSTFDSRVPEPRLKRYERGDQKMTLISAPVMDVATDRVEGVVTLMLGGGLYKPEVVLPRLDGIVAVASAVLAARSRSLPDTTTATTARPVPVAAVANAASGVQPGPVPGATTTPNRQPDQQTGDMQQAAALGKASQFHSTREFGFSLVNSLYGQLQAEQVMFGVAKGDRVVVEAISGVPDFKVSSPGVAIVRQAMEECLDAKRSAVAQQENLEGLDAMPIHRQWSAESGQACVCSLPLKQGDEVTGVVSVRRPAGRPFRKEEIAGLMQMLAPYGAAVRTVERANRSVGTQLKTAVSETARNNLRGGSVGRKLVLAGMVAGVLWFLFGSLTYRPICRTRVVSADLRHFSAPFSGKLDQVLVRPGQQVAEGELLAVFDTADLELQLNTLNRQFHAVDVELRQSIADGDMSKAALAKSRVSVLQVQMQAIRKQIDEASLRAPSAGTVLLSDLDQRIGQMFRQGEELLQFAGDGDWLLEIEVPDDLVGVVADQQTGTFAAASLPTEKLEFTVNQIDGAARTIQDRNVFIARAPLQARPPWMKTGMEGTSRITTVPRPVWWVAMHRVVDWGRMNFWF